MNQRLLKNTLLSNALFSLTSGILLFIFHIKISSLMGISNTLILKYIGFGLIIFCVYLFFTALKPSRNKLEVWAIIIQDLLWVVASLIILLLNPFGITSVGNLMIGGIASIVALFAFLQYWSIKAIK